MFETDSWSIFSGFHHLPIFFNYGSHVKGNFSARLLSRKTSRNPYEVLGIKSSASAKEVKNAYIELCKELHPDMRPGDASQHKKFVELNDAYTKIMNGEDKVRDSPFADDLKENAYARQYYTRQSTAENAWYEKKAYREQFHHHNQKSQFIHHKMSLRRSNKLILAGCFTLVVIGYFLHYTAYHYAKEYKSRTVDERSRRISEDYNEMRKNAIDRGSTEQIDKLRKSWTT